MGMLIEPLHIITHIMLAQEAIFTMYYMEMIQDFLNNVIILINNLKIKYGNF